MSEGFSLSRDFTVDRAFLDRRCSDTPSVMHPLPRDSRPGANDLDVDLNGDPRLAICRQTDNGIPVRMAIFATLLGVDDLIDFFFQAEDGIRDGRVTGVQTCALPI